MADDRMAALERENAALRRVAEAARGWAYEMGDARNWPPRIRTLIEAVHALDALAAAQQPETRAVDVVTLGLMQSTRKSQPDYMACAEPEQEDPPPHHHRHRAPAS